MKSSAAFSALFVFPAVQALSLPRSQHDGMLRRNFKNVLHHDAPKVHVARSPQGPASNPGEFTNVGLSNVNPENQEGESGSGTGSGAGSAYIPEPTSEMEASWMTDTEGGSNTAPSAQAAISSGGSLSEYLPVYSYEHTGGSCYAGPTGTGTAWPPPPTGGPHPCHNETGLYGHSDVDGLSEADILEVEMEVEPDGEVIVEETLWQFNGTGWNSTDIPLPSGSLIGTLIPVPTRTGSAPTSTGTGKPGFENGGLIRPGFTGPGARLTADEMTRNEIAADGTGMEQVGVMTEDDVGMTKRGDLKEKRWLSGWI